MKFSFKFLKKIIDIEIPPQELADKLTAAGLEIENLKKTPSDWVFDAEVTTNRFDWLSLIGIAQEVAAVLGKKIKIDYPRLKGSSLPLKPKIINAGRQACPYYIGRVLEGVKVSSSPKWLSQLLFNCGINSVNNIVDITNYCMLKWGNPLHAFDLDKVEGNIYIRRAEKGEVFTGIDEKERQLCSQNLVIADSRKIIALAGVIGAKNTEITPTAQNIFLEAAKFDPVSIRRSRRQAGLDTESSYRFERRVSASFLEYASQEAADLITHIAGGRLKGYKRIGKKETKSGRRITISLPEMREYLGIDFKKSRAVKILKSLNFAVREVSASKIKIKPAVSRFDIEREVDVYEEFARIFGYDKIEPAIPFLKKSRKKNRILTDKERLWRFKNKIRDFVSLSGCSEIITYSMENGDELSSLVSQEGLGLRNPLRKQENTLRPSLLLGLIKAVRHNLNRGKTNLRFFEIADIYRREKGSPAEMPVLSLGLTGRKENFFFLKGLVLDIFSYLSIRKIEFKQAARKSFLNSLDIICGGSLVGFLAKLDQRVKKEFGLKEDLFFSQLDIVRLRKNKKDKIFRPFSKFPAVWRDISLALAEDVEFAEVRKIMKRESKHLAGFKIIDTYQSKGLPRGYRAFTLRVFYQSGQKTLSSGEVDDYHTKIREKLSGREGIILR